MTFVRQTLKQQDGNKLEEKQADGCKVGEGGSGDGLDWEIAVLLQYTVPQKYK